MAQHAKGSSLCVAAVSGAFRAYELSGPLDLSSLRKTW